MIGSQDMKCQKDKLDGNTDGVDHVIRESQKKIDYLKRMSEWRLKAIVVLSFALGITLVTIIAALLIDKFNPDLGFIWRNLQN